MHDDGVNSHVPVHEADIRLGRLLHAAHNEIKRFLLLHRVAVVRKSQHGIQDMVRKDVHVILIASDGVLHEIEKTNGLPVFGLTCDAREAVLQYPGSDFLQLWQLTNAEKDLRLQGIRLQPEVALLQISPFAGGFRTDAIFCRKSKTGEI